MFLDLPPCGARKKEVEETRPASNRIRIRNLLDVRSLSLPLELSQLPKANRTLVNNPLCILFEYFVLCMSKSFEN